MKFIKALITFALLAHSAAALADPPAQVGRLSHLQGTVSFASADPGNEWMVAQLNWPVTTGDRLWADRDGRAEMRIGSTAIRVNALTSVDILRLDDQGTQLRLPQGTLNIRLRQLDPGDSFEVSTPGGAVLLTRPGSYRVHVDPAGATTAVLVRQGQADVLTGGNPPFSLHDNQFATLSNAGHHILGAPAPDEFDNWAFARDRQEERVVATRYVAPAMTGYEDLDQHGTWHSEPQYGNVWVPAVAALPVGWAPYRYGRWAWVSPWGWTWIDNAPWGFAPYHYGRWVWLGHRWGWAPGVRVARPVYAPALVAFVGGRNWSVSVASGPAVGWVPLGWREPYIPWYRHSPRYVRNVNVTHVTNVTVINQYSNVNNVTRIRYVNRDVPAATTVVAHDTFVRARHVHKERLDVPAQALATAQVTHAAPVVQPGRRHSLAAEQPGTRLPQTVAAREVVAARAPAAPVNVVMDGGPGKGRDAREAHDKGRADNERKGRDERRTANERIVGNERQTQDDRPRVRVLNAQAMQQPATPPRGTPETTPQIAAPAGLVPMAPADTKSPSAGDARAADKAPLRADTKGAGEAPRRPGSQERAAERAQAVPDNKAAADAPRRPAVAMSPGERERAVERARIAPDTKAGDAPKPPTTTLAPNDAQRLQQQQQERQQREEQQRQARAQQEKQQQDQKEQQQRALAAQQQQERQAQQAREEQQRQARALQEKQAQEQQQQRALAQQQQERQAQQAREEQQRQTVRAQQEQQLQAQREQQRALAAQQQQERQAREEQQRQARAQQQQQLQAQQEQQRLLQQQQQQRLLQQQQAMQQQQERQARQQRAMAAQQQREQQHVQAQQAEQQRQAQRQQRREEREAKRRPPENPEQAPPQARAR